MTLGGLFSGIGGLELGLERAGFTCRWQVELDPFCRRVLAKHWPHVTRHRDVRKVGAHNLEPVDVLCGGFPCQDVSDAGLRAGIDGARSGLWSEYCRIIRELRPRGVVIENVAGLAVRGLDRVLGDLAALRYNAEWFRLRARDVGAPHNRRRLFIVAYPNADAEQFDQQRQRSGETFDREIAAATGIGRVVGTLADAEPAGREQCGQAHDGDRRDAPRHEPDRCGAGLGDADLPGQGIAGEGDTWRERDSGRHAATAAGNVSDTGTPRLPLAESDDLSGTGRRLEGRAVEQLRGASRRRPDWLGDIVTERRPVADVRYGGEWIGWPARPGADQSAWEPPRVLRRAVSGMGIDPDGLPAGLVRHRRRAIAALGNAVVPQVAEVVGHIVLARLRDRTGGVNARTCA